MPPMIPFAKRTHWTTHENQLSQIAAVLKGNQTPVLDLTVSNPTKCGFQYLKTDLLKCFSDPKNLVYDPNPRGLLQAREQIAQYYAEKGVTVHPDHIFITANTSEAYSFIFKLLFEPQDTLLAPQPSYPLLDYLAGLHDISINRYPLEPKQNWTINLSGHYELHETHPKAVLVVNPNNPTGNFLHAQELAELNLFCKGRPTAIVSDEVFLDFPLTEGPASDPQGARISAASTRHTLTFTLSGISKILGLPQMKLSWIVISGPAELAREAMTRLEIISDTYLSAGTPVQNALSEWFSQSKTIQGEILKRIRSNYEHLQTQLSQGGAVRHFPVQGGWSVPIQLPGHHTDEEWACLFLEKAQVLTHPGYLFDFSEGSFLVLSLLVPESVFQEGLGKILRSVSL